MPGLAVPTAGQVLRMATQTAFVVSVEMMMMTATARMILGSVNVVSVGLTKVGTTSAVSAEVVTTKTGRPPIKRRRQRPQ